MVRQARLDALGVLHHVMARGIERRPIFIDDRPLLLTHDNSLFQVIREKDSVNKWFAPHAGKPAGQLAHYLPMTTQSKDSSREIFRD
jgi:hypothetical protein